MIKTSKQPTSTISDSYQNPPTDPLHIRLFRPLMRSLWTLRGLATLSLLRLRYYGGLSLLALIGVILAIGLVTSAAFFAQAVDKVMMARELAEYSRVTNRAPFSARVFAASSTSVPLTLERAETLGGHVADTLSDEIGLPVKQIIMLVDSGILELQPAADDSRYANDRPLSDVSAVYMTGIADHISLVEGLSFDDAPANTPIPVWMHESFAAELGAQIGDTYSFITGDGIAIPIQTMGFWQPTDPTDPYWLSDPDQTMRTKLLLRRQDYLAALEPVILPKVRTATWQVILDETRAVPAQARNYMDGFQKAAIIIPRYLPDARITTPSLTLEKFVGRQTALTTLLLGFNVPALGFLFYFLVLTSAVIAYWQRRETALLKSRGITQGSILSFTMMEAVLLFLIGCPLGLMFGFGIARLMGYSVSFLSFDWRPALPVSLNGLNLPLTVATLGVVLVAKVWTVASTSGETVVTQEREHSRPTRGPFWYRNYLDLLLLIPTFYAYRQLVQQGWLGALVQDRPEDLYQDPLLILVPGLFIIAISLVAMRLFPLLMRLLDYIARVVPWFTSYLALRQLGRQSHNYINPLLLVIISLALGVYTISMAASMDQWLEDRVYYQVGTDLTFTPFSESEALSSGDGASPGADWIPPIDEFTLLPGIDKATRVGNYTAEISLAGPAGRVPAQFMGIDRVDFPSVAWYRYDFAPESLGSLMNRLAVFPEGILVPQDFLEDNNLQIGDTLSILVLPDFGVRVNAPFTIVGIYQHFPTVYDERVTVIGNLDYIFSFFGVTMPHQIWLNLEDGASGEAVLSTVPETGIDVIQDNITQTILNEEQAQMERVGVFGTLSVSFLAASLMAALGLLTYSYASLHERLFQFSLLRAIGLRRNQIVGQVVLEYMILTTYGAVAGVICGSIAAQLFVPLFRVSTAPGAPLPPLLPVMAQSEVIALALIFSIIMIGLEILIISTALHRRLFEALRLGHHG